MRNESISKMEPERYYSLSDYNNDLFYQMPKWLYRGNYKKLSNNDRCLYMFLKERFCISVKNKWIDENGRIYFFYKKAELENALCISRRTVLRCFEALKREGLLTEERQGGNLPNRIYLLKPDAEAAALSKSKDAQQEMKEALSVQQREDSLNQNDKEKDSCLEDEGQPRKEEADIHLLSGGDKMARQEDKNSEPGAILSLGNGQNDALERSFCHAKNKKRINKRESNINYLISKSASISKSTSTNKKETPAYEEYVNLLKKQINYDAFVRCGSIFDETDQAIIDNVLFILAVHVFSMADKEKINVSNKDSPQFVTAFMLKDIFLKKLDFSVMRSYLRQFCEKGKPVRNPVQYHIAGLYRQCIAMTTVCQSRNKKIDL